MSVLDSIDFFTDQSLIPDPYPYFEQLRAHGPVVRLPHHGGVFAITGHPEAVSVYKDATTFSSCIAGSGPFPGLPFDATGPDARTLVAEHLHELPMGDFMMTFDPPRHTRTRALLSRLLTPRRLKENEEFMHRLADSQLDGILADGRCEFLGDYAKPFAMLIIADLLGVPTEDHEEFRNTLANNKVGVLGGEEAQVANPLLWLEETFTAYVEERRRRPRGDVLTELAEAKYPDGSTPEVIEVVRTATFLFAAGQETSTRLLGEALRTMCQRPELQEALRRDVTGLPTFIEETLRMESPVKSDFRLALATTELAGVRVPSGSIVMILPGAVNRDPRTFDDPHEFRPDRPNVREHIAFGRGIHSCPGGPLARVEARVTLERLLRRTGDVRIDDVAHGPVGARRFDYEPTYILRGLTGLHLTFDQQRGQSQS